MRQMRIRKYPARLISCALGLGLLFGAAPVSAKGGSNNKGKVTVVHAVPDLPVDVYANDSKLLNDFMPGEIVGPVALAAGEYELDVTGANSTDPILSATADVTKGLDATAVAYLKGNGDPTLGLFVNKMQPIQDDRARMTVRHTAAAPEVDVRWKRPGGNWRVFAPDLKNGQEKTRWFCECKRSFDVVLAGTNTRVLGPATFDLEDETHYFVYAWGSAADDSLALNLSTRHLEEK